MKNSYNKRAKSSVEKEQINIIALKKSETVH